MRIYISGPMTGHTNFNHPRFHDAETRLRNAGHDPVNPARHPTGLTWEQYLRLDLTDLLTCDAVAALPGWSHSRGATLEIHVADNLNIPVQPLHHYTPTTEAAA